MGAHVREIVEDEEAEPIGVIEIQGARLKGTVIEGKEIPNVIDEIPILAVAAALSLGTTTIANASELRVKETDRLAAIATNLRAMGGQVSETEDGLEIVGGMPLHGARLDSFGDHRIAMAFAVAGLFAEGETVITNTECVNTSYPGFFQTLESLLKEPTGVQTHVITSLPTRE
jgi:3-phosphoshikimate 1-carboxyvinyltransferase